MPTSIMEHKIKIPIIFRWVLSNATMLMERLGSQLFAGISVSDQWIESKFKKFGTKNLFYFPNYPRLDDFSSINLEKVPKKYDFCILGSMSERTGVLEFINALVILKNRGWNGKARLIGEPSPDLNSLIKKIVDAEKVDISISGRVPYQNVPAALSECFVGAIPLLDMKKFHRNPATKMFEYAASGLYIVASDLPPQRKFLQDSSFAVLVKPGDSVALANGLEEMLHSRIRSSGDAPRHKYLSEWNADYFYNDMENYYKKGIFK
ncbi:glycosyltransferase [Nitrosomonas nitrosa]|nr:glycosyltransferase [Nitrosomonas nitrosa]